MYTRLARARARTLIREYARCLPANSSYVNSERLKIRARIITCQLDIRELRNTQINAALKQDRLRITCATATSFFDCIRLITRLSRRLALITRNSRSRASREKSPPSGRSSSNNAVEDDGGLYQEGARSRSRRAHISPRERRVRPSEGDHGA